MHWMMSVELPLLAPCWVSQEALTVEKQGLLNPLIPAHITMAHMCFRRELSPSVFTCCQTLKRQLESPLAQSPEIRGGGLGHRFMMFHKKEAQELLLWLSRWQTQLVPMRMWVPSLVSPSGLRIQLCSCSEQWGHSLVLALLWLWHRLKEKTNKQKRKPGLLPISWLPKERGEWFSVGSSVRTQTQSPHMVPPWRFTQELTGFGAANFGPCGSVWPIDILVSRVMSTKPNCCRPLDPDSFISSALESNRNFSPGRKIPLDSSIQEKQNFSNYRTCGVRGMILIQWGGWLRVCFCDTPRLGPSCWYALQPWLSTMAAHQNLMQSFKNAGCLGCTQADDLRASGVGPACAPWVMSSIRRRTLTPLWVPSATFPSFFFLKGKLSFRLFTSSEMFVDFNVNI